ncbi:MAG TPA: hypothetical protein VJT73_13985 [Polyangiaceae bacterium]|nr:hypothetical protein [Polyangiaceae bacterium]
MPAKPSRPYASLAFAWLFAAGLLALLLWPRPKAVFVPRDHHRDPLAIDFPAAVRR